MNHKRRFDNWYLVGAAVLSLVTLTVVLLITVRTGSESPSGPSTATSATQPTSEPTVDMYAQARREAAQLVETKASLDAPPSVPFDEQSPPIKLVIADPRQLMDEVSAVPYIDQSPSTATVKVGPHIRAWLNVDSNEVDVLPNNDPQDQTDFDYQFNFTWWLHPKKPGVKTIQLSADIQVVLADGSQLPPVEIPHPDVHIDGGGKAKWLYLLTNWILPILGGLAALAAVISGLYKGYSRLTNRGSNDVEVDDGDGEVPAADRTTATPPNIEPTEPDAASEAESSEEQPHPQTDNEPKTSNNPTATEPH